MHHLTPAPLEFFSIAVGQHSKQGVTPKPSHDFMYFVALSK